MSEAAAAVLILPTLGVLVLVLECSRVGCTRLSRRLRGAKLATGEQLSVAL